LEARKDAKVKGLSFRGLILSGLLNMSRVFCPSGHRYQNTSALGNRYRVLEDRLPSLPSLSAGRQSKQIARKPSNTDVLDIPSHMQSLHPSCVLHSLISAILHLSRRGKSPLAAHRGVSRAETLADLAF
jgi:hypothetical protein